MGVYVKFCIFVERLLNNKRTVRNTFHFKISRNSKLSTLFKDTSRQKKPLALYAFPAERLPDKYIQTFSPRVHPISLGCVPRVKNLSLGR